MSIKKANRPAAGVVPNVHSGSPEQWQRIEAARFNAGCARPETTEPAGVVPTIRSGSPEQWQRIETARFNAGTTRPATTNPPMEADEARHLPDT